jgi:hypothetical protein
MLMSQRSAITVPTWLQPASWATVKVFLDDMFTHRYLMAMLMIVWLAHLIPSFTPVVGRTRKWLYDLTQQASVTGLIVMPFIIIALSFCWHSMLLPRYCLPALAALAPAIAYPLSRIAWPWASLVGVLFMASGINEVHARIKMYQADDETDAIVRAIEGFADNHLVIYESPSKMYVVCRYAPHLCQHAFLLDFEKGDFANITDSRIFVRDLARNYAKYYPTCNIMTWPELRKQPYFFLITNFLAPGVNGVVWEEGPYPGFNMRQLQKDVYEVFWPEKRKH